MALTQISTNGIKDTTIATADIADDAVNADKLANSINTEIAANTAKVTNATHTGEVTGATALTIADNAVTLAKMAGGTDGNLITYDTSGDPAHVTTGNAGQILTSNGAGAAPTFQAAPTSGATLSGSTNNTVVTVTGANAVQGEANLTFDGTSLNLTGYIGQGRDSATSYGPSLTAKHQRGTIASPAIVQSGDTLYSIVAKGYDGSDSYDDCARIDFKSGAGTPGAGDMPGSIVFSTTNDGAASTTPRLTILQNGDVKVENGNLWVDSGHGIDFSATSDAGGMTNELLDDYEEGTWTPTQASDNQAPNGSTMTTTGTRNGWYRKVGSLVFISWNMYGFQVASGNTGQAKIIGLPFTPLSNSFAAFPLGVVNQSTTFQHTQTVGGALSNTGIMFYYDGFGYNNWTTTAAGHVGGSGCYQTA